MSFARAYRYEMSYCRRLASGVSRSLVLPSWTTGRGARLAWLFALVVLVVGYVAQTSLAAGSGFKLRDLQKNVTALNEDIRDLEADAAGYNSLSGVEKRLVELGMVAPDNVKHYSPLAPPVAKK